MSLHDDKTPLPEDKPAGGALLRNMLRGALIYGAGDAVAALILHAFSPIRLLGMALVGGLLYAWEIPCWFGWINRWVPVSVGGRSALARTALAVLYFNPLWIARHLLFILLFTGRGAEIGWTLLGTGWRSFAANIPVAVVANYLIQNRIPLRGRFVASALFSALMAVYYAMSQVWFR